MFERKSRALSRSRDVLIQVVVPIAVGTGIFAELGALTVPLSPL